jgi:hypothetical protein
MMLATISSMLGTVWFVLLVGVVSFVSGVYFADTVKKMLGR